MSISMVLKTFSPIRCFLHYKWPPAVRRKKKKVSWSIGDPVGGRDAQLSVQLAMVYFRFTQSDTIETPTYKKVKRPVYEPHCCQH